MTTTSILRQGGVQCTSALRNAENPQKLNTVEGKVSEQDKTERQQSGNITSSQGGYEQLVIKWREEEWKAIFDRPRYHIPSSLLILGSRSSGICQLEEGPNCPLLVLPSGKEDWWCRLTMFVGTLNDGKYRDEDLITAPFKKEKAKYKHQGKITTKICQE